MTDWPGNGGKRKSDSNFKLSFYNRPWDTDKGFLFKFGAI